MDKVCLYIVRDRASENHCFCFACPLCIIIYGRRYRALSTRTTRHRNSCFPQAIHLMNTTLNVKHTTLLYNYLFTTHTCFFSISNLHTLDLYTHNCLYYILCYCYFLHCLFVYYYFIICVLLLSFCSTVELLSL